MGWFEKAVSNVETFGRSGGLGPDPLALAYEDRRKDFSLFSTQLSDAQIEKLRKYVFAYDRLPLAPSDQPIRVSNFIAGSWVLASKSVVMANPGDRRIKLAEVPDSGSDEVEAALRYAHDYWTSLKWSEETVTYRKQVVKNFSRILHYFYEDCLKEIRAQISKTRLEAEKDFWEAKRAADHLEGAAERELGGRMFPQLIEGHTYWKNPHLPAGVAAIITPMNFIYGIPVIHLVGAYLAGAPLIFKGHPFSAITNTTLIRLFLAAGADPRSVQKIEGFGGRVENLVKDHRVAVVALTGSDATAAHMQSLRGLRPVRYEGGGCNWSFVDDGFSDDDLNRIAVRLAYSKLGFSSHKCTTLHGVAGSKAILDRLLPMISREMDQWKVANPAQLAAGEVKVVGPCMVHRAKTATDIQNAAERAGARVFRKGGKITAGEYAENAEVIDPIILSEVRPGMKVTVDWDGKGERSFDLTTTEFFMPILVASEMRGFDDFLRFCLVHNEHDLAVSIWSRSDSLLQKGRRVLAGMVKENDGTDSALEWEEFGASGMGPSGNMGVGDPEATFAIYSRRQKGRHLVF